MSKLAVILGVILLVISSSTVLAKGGNSGSGGDDDRVRIEVRGEDDSSRVRFESRDDGDRVRVELRAEDEDEPGDEDFEIEGNTFEITGTVTAFTGSTVTIDGRIITIDASLVTNFEQEGTIETGEVIKVEGMVASDGTLLAREIKANGVEEVEAGLSVATLTALLNQITAFLQGLM